MSDFCARPKFTLIYTGLDSGSSDLSTDYICHAAALLIIPLTAHGLDAVIENVIITPDMQTG